MLDPCQKKFRNTLNGGQKRFEKEIINKAHNRDAADVEHL